MTKPIALDAMGGDFAPEAAIEGAKLAAKDFGIDVVLVGRPEDLKNTGNIPVWPASEVVPMDDESAAQSVRKMKDSSLAVAAKACRDGKAAGMVSAGNTGAAMASSLLKLGRLSGVARPAIATPIPVPGATPTVLLDAGANAECLPQYLVQFAQMGSIFATERFGIESPRVGLLSIGEEASKGNALVKETHQLLKDPSLKINFVGNVEGRDIMSDGVDVVVTDGFTGNVVLKTLEGALKTLVKSVFSHLVALPVQEHADAAVGALMPLAADLDPDRIGGAMLLGVSGVSVISHGSSSPTAIASALRVADEMARADLVSHLAVGIKRVISEA